LNSVVDSTFFGNAEFYAKVFSRKVSIVSLKLEYKSSKLKGFSNNIFLSVAGGVILNSAFLPTLKMNTCAAGSKPLISKSFDDLLSFSFVIVVGVVPLKLGIGVTAEIGIDYNYIVCPGKNIISFSVEPWFNTGIK
jgi:hypothetical protein